jgi:endoglucanase
MKNIIVLVFTVTLISPVIAQKNGASIQLNQVGFYPAAPKVAVITGAAASHDFFIISKENRDTILKGKLSGLRQSKFSSATTRIADFSAIKKAGEYVLTIGNTISHPFIIKKNIYKDVAIASLKGFYYQRSDMPLQEQFAGKWHRSAGHPDTVVYVHPSAASKERPAGSIISSPKGWYDAGDYNKYIVNSGITMGTLLSAYEDFEKYFSKQRVNIPESNNQIPDILDEALYNLRWMLTMQDPNDGGVYHKLTNAAFDGMVMPGVTKDQRYVVQKGTAAALDFAAVTAQAARIFNHYKKQVPGLADSCLMASKKAWQWAKSNPAVLYRQEEFNKILEPAITTGGYGDRNMRDEFSWAAAELFITTKDKSFYQDFLKYKADTISLPGWSNVDLLGRYSLIRFQSVLPAYTKDELAVTKTKMLDIADRYILNAANNAYQTVMGQSIRDFNWGSNSVAANQGILLINAYLISKNKSYLNGAISNLDYLLGRNATGYSFVTGYGSTSPMHPHHRPSEADGIVQPVPGLLVGGPNPGMQDKCSYQFKEPETAYTDDVCSYASNEIAINWNAPLVYLVNAIEAVVNK